MRMEHLPAAGRIITTIGNSVINDIAAIINVLTVPFARYMRRRNHIGRHRLIGAAA